MNKVEITIEDIKMDVLYIRHRGSYTSFRKEVRDMLKELFDFGFKHKIIKEGVSKVLTIYDDNPYITDNENLRTSVGITRSTDEVIEYEGIITERVIEGNYAIFHFELNRPKYRDAWEYIYNDWAKNTSEILRDSVPFELYVNEPAKNTKDRSLVDIYIPIE